MKKRRNLKDLTIRDNFMFAAVMTEAPDICREVLEYALGIHIDRIEVAAEKTILYHPEFRGIRLRRLCTGYGCGWECCTSF